MRSGTAFRICLVTTLLAGCAQSAKVAPALSPSSQVVEGLQTTEQDDCRSNSRLGRLYLSENRLDGARSFFEKALASDAECIEASILLAVTLKRYPHPDLVTAASVLERAILRYPDHADAHLNLGQVYYSIHRRDDAYREFESALSFSREFSTLISAHLGLMAICQERGDHEEAARQYELAKKIYPQLDRILIQDEIHRLTPAPVYVGDPFRGDGIHPSWEHRIQKLERQLGRIPGGMK